MYIHEGLVKYFFYEKPCVAKIVIPKVLVHSKRIRMSVLVEDGVRRMRNCSRRLGDEDWSVRVGILEKWCMKLRRSGYPVTMRHQVIKAAIDRWEEMCKIEDNGGRPIHRAREYQKTIRRVNKEMKSIN